MYALSPTHSYINSDAEYANIWRIYKAGSETTTYTYSFKYDSTVTSTNQYAYSTGNTASYTSSSNNDIRTVYVKA